MSSSYIDSDMVPIGQFLATAKSIRVPAFQRSYAWTDEEVRQLWIDITESLDSTHPDYFLGPMVLKSGDGQLEIIDGQQRITTILIFLSAIRKIFRQIGDNDRADWFRQKYFGERDVNTLDTEPKFHMNEENDPIFQLYVGADSTEKQVKDEMKGRLKKDTNYLLLQAIQIVQDVMEGRQKEISGQSFDADTLLNLHKYIEARVFVLLLKVEDEADAYVIFETLNDRGRGLNTMDLLKNHVFGNGRTYLDQIKAHWGLIKENLSDIDPSEKFLYHYWSSIHGRTSKTKLFRLMRTEIKGPKSALGFALKLNESSKLYSALNIPGHPYWNDFDQRTRDSLMALNLLDAQQALPILLAAAAEFSATEFSKLTEVLVVMAVRYNLIGELRTGVSANYYSDIPPQIRSGSITKSAKVFRKLKPIYPSDLDFKDAFSSKSIKNAAKARYLLGQIEKFLSGGKNEVVNDTRHVNLEHVLPKNPSSEWGGIADTFEPHEFDDYVNRIGNLALVSTVVNKNVGSKGFDFKKNELFSKEEQFVFTHQIVDYADWNKDSILDRQEKLAETAVKVWKIDID